MMHRRDRCIVREAALHTHRSPCCLARSTRGRGRASRKLQVLPRWRVSYLKRKKVVLKSKESPERAVKAIGYVPRRAYLNHPFMLLYVALSEHNSSVCKSALSTGMRMLNTSKHKVHFQHFASAARPQGHRCKAHGLSQAC